MGQSVFPGEPSGFPVKKRQHLRLVPLFLFALGNVLLNQLPHPPFHHSCPSSSSNIRLYCSRVISTSRGFAPSASLTMPRRYISSMSRPARA